MLLNVRSCCAVLASLISLPVALAQQPAPLSHGAAQDMVLNVVVTPKSGPPVAELRQQDFTLLDNKSPQALTSFRAISGNVAPAEVVLVLDAVNVSYDRLAYERDQLDKFLRANGGKLAHPTALVIFTDTATQIQGNFMTDGNVLAEALKKDSIGLRDIRRDSQYGGEDRLQLSLKALDLVTSHETDRPGRKMVLWISPGWPILSGPRIMLDNRQQQQIFSSVVSMSNRMRQANITLYAIDSLGPSEGVGRVFYYQEFEKGVSKPGQTQLGDLSLQVLAEQSGGLALNSSGVVQLLQQCLADTDAYYELHFHPLPADQPNEYHHVDVKVDRPGLVARTRDGYYAQP